MSSSAGLAIIPDFLCLGEIQTGDIQLLWKGFKPPSYILYFAMRKQNIYPNQIQKIEEILAKEMPQLLE